MNKEKKKIRLSVRILIIVVALGILCVAAGAAINIGVVKSAEEYILTEEEAAGLGADCVLVLGAKVYSDGRLSDVLADRVITGAGVYKAGGAGKVIVSGDHGSESYDEVDAMAAAIEKEGVAYGDIFLDHAGFSTYESVCRAKDVFGAKKIIIVTQEFHISRAVYLARAVGLDAYGVVADRREYAYALRNETRELLARIKAFGDVVFRPAPTYLGEAIPLTGSGSVTRN